MRRMYETIDGNTIIREGDPFRAYFGYQAIGIFRTTEEVSNAPVPFKELKQAVSSTQQE